jgi:hypothetical protein
VKNVRLVAVPDGAVVCTRFVVTGVQCLLLRNGSALVSVCIRFFCNCITFTIEVRNIEGKETRYPFYRRLGGPQGRSNSLMLPRWYITLPVSFKRVRARSSFK